MGGKGRGRKKESGGEGREGEGCVMAFGGWTPLFIALVRKKL